jgi:hypothetical protein
LIEETQKLEVDADELACGMGAASTRKAGRPSRRSI